MDIWDRALGFMDAQVLLTSTELGVFTRIGDGAATPGELARHTGLDEQIVARLATALCSMGVLHRTPDGRVRNSPEALDRLVEGRPEYIGGLFHHIRHELYPLWGNLSHALHEGQSQWTRTFGETPPNEQRYDDEDALRRFMDGMHAITYRAASDFASYSSELASIRSVVDVGGASGAMLIALAERHQHLRGTIVDLPSVRPIAESYIKRHGLVNRIEFAARDFWSDELPCDADAYSLGFILHDWDESGGSLLLEKVARAIPPHGRLIVGEYLLDDDRTGPHWVARSDLNMLVAARGAERTLPEYRTWLERFGFALDRTYQTSNGKHFMVASVAR